MTNCGKAFALGFCSRSAVEARLARAQRVKQALNNLALNRVTRNTHARLRFLQRWFVEGEFLCLVGKLLNREEVFASQFVPWAKLVLHDVFDFNFCMFCTTTKAVVT